MKEINNDMDKQQEIDVVNNENPEQHNDGEDMLKKDTKAKKKKEKKEKKEKREVDTDKKKKESGGGNKGFLQFLQHALITGAVVAILTVISGSSVSVRDIYGNKPYNYTLLDIDGNEKYEDSYVFSSIFKREVSEILRFGVLRSQMETDGKFDGKKIIDVTAYNNRTSPMPEQYVTAEYYLEDLLKWGNHGFEYADYSPDNKELNNFLNEYTIVTVLGNNKYYGYPSDYYYMKTPEGIFTSGVSGNSLYVDYTDGVTNAASYKYIAEVPINENVSESSDDIQLNYYYDVLLNRYTTVEGKNIEDYTSKLEDYLALCDNVTGAIQDLTYNYDEYTAYSRYYDAYNTNIRYCIEKTVGNHTEYFTNMLDDSIDGTQEAGVDKAAFFEEVFDGKMNGQVERYLYYSPDEMIYESNSDIDSEQMRNMLKEYSYAYPDNVRLWIGVNSSYAANDALSDGFRGYNNYVPNMWKYLIGAVAAIVLYLMLFIYLTVTVGRTKDENGNKFISLTEFDRLPTGLGIVLGAVAAAIIIIAGSCLFNWWLDIGMKNDYYNMLVGAAVFIADMLFLFFYYSLVRRIKAKTLWKNSYLRRIFVKCSAMISELYANSNITLRTWIPYVLFLLFNFIMAVFALMAWHSVWLFIVIAFTIAADAVIGMMLFRDVRERQDILNVIGQISAGNFSYKVEQENVHGYNTELAKSVNSIGNGIKNAVESSMKDERMKTELITNVSHDIKTPLTSIINYVDLIKREEIDNERVRNYIKILDEKSQRLKQLTDDLVEASKISSGNINFTFEKINMTELLNQTIGEFSEKFEEKNLNIVLDIKAANTVIEADSRRIWRIMENLFNNIYKYAMEGTRVYVVVRTLQHKELMEQVEISLKNISATELNCNPEELTERFIRGDESRTTEGSGLGLSIAKNLTEAQNGRFEIQLDGDLFKVILTFPVIKN